MNLISSTEFKLMAPKRGFIAPYIRFPWNQERTLIGKPVSIYKVDGGFFLSTESNELKPLDQQKIESNITKLKNIEFKPSEIENNYGRSPGSRRRKTANIKTGLKGFEPLTCGLRVHSYGELNYKLNFGRVMSPPQMKRYRR